MLVEGILYHACTTSYQAEKMASEITEQLCLEEPISVYEKCPGIFYLIAPYPITNADRFKPVNMVIGETIFDCHDGAHFLVCCNNLGRTKLHPITKEVFKYNVFYVNR